MTRDEIEEIRATFALVRPLSETAAALFYGRLFEIAPEARGLFPQDLTGQGAKLMAMLGLAVDHLDEPEVLWPRLDALGRRHAGYGVKSEHFEPVGEALLWTLAQGLGERFTPAARAAWQDAYALLAGRISATCEAASQAVVVSHVRGATEPPLLHTTIGERLRAVAAETPEGEALVSPHQQVRWTWAELDRRVDALAAGLLRLGLQPGDRLGIWSPNRAEWVLTQFATARIGVILVTINPAYRSAELEHALTLVGCRALILPPRHKTSDYLALLGEVAPELADARPGALAAARLPALRFVITLGEPGHPGAIPFETLTAEPSAAERQTLATIASGLSPTDPINIQFTSGTTGSPKGATLTHHNILNNGYFIGRGMRLTAADRLCIPVPLYHCFGMVIGNLAALTHGATMVLAGPSFDAAATLSVVEQERCTVLHGVPTMFIAMLEHQQVARHDLSSLRTGMMAGAPCPTEVMRRVMDELNMSEVTIGYGMTETAPISFQTALDDPIALRVGTVGRVQPHLEVKIVDPEGGTVNVGEIGELWTRGYSVMNGYWREGAPGAGIDQAGWMHTGDLATLDGDGYCRIVGRAKDMVIRGGENIFPAEIEQFLHGHPEIQDVQVVGVPDDRLGEALCACIIARSGAVIDEAEVQRFCKDKIAHFKAPRYVRLVEEFPLTVSGKVRKFVLRDESARALGLQPCA